ncbi:MAG: cell wall biosynthesis protein [Methanobacterium sp.]|nr:cell wall biosynthesis protein [Methanobacterium sp.]
MEQILLLLSAFLLSALLTLLFKFFFSKWGGHLYTPIRGGTPRAVGLAPFLVLLIFFPPPGNYLIAIIGVFAFLDDLIGRRKIGSLPFELGQLSRGIGMLLVIMVGYFFFGPVSILIALMIQPLNIADMQPGTASYIVIIMASLMAVLLYFTSGDPYSAALIVLVACLGYAPLDYYGRVMMGEVGNHSFGVALGVLFTYLGINIASFHNWGDAGVFIIVFILLLVTAFLIAFLRRKNLRYFLEEELQISDPSFGDMVMDVLTGGGLGDLMRKIFLKKSKIIIENKYGKFLGLRRLLYNPLAIE